MTQAMLIATVKPRFSLREPERLPGGHQGIESYFKVRMSQK